MNEDNLTAAGLPVEPLNFAFRSKKRKPATPTSEPTAGDPTKPTAVAEPQKASHTAAPPAQRRTRTKAVAVEPAGEPAAAPVATRKKRAPGRPLGGGREVMAEETTQLVAYLPEDLAEKLRVASSRRRQPRGDVIIAAAAALAGEAADLVSAAETSSDSEVAVAGFTVPTGRQKRVSVSFQTTGANRDALHALIVSSGATDRTHLVTVLLEAYLAREGA